MDRHPVAQRFWPQKVNCDDLRWSLAFLAVRETCFRELKEPALCVYPQSLDPKELRDS